MPEGDIRNDPWYRTALTHDALGAHLRLAVPHDVFSTMRIDEGTLLLLENLPAKEPAHVLDMGCGYGALGLPIAARFPAAQVILVDRDLLAVHWAKTNALAHGLSNVSVYGSLGYRDVPEEERFDWILCNVPARIGEPFIRHLLACGRTRLTETGELRIVAINDLSPVIEGIGVSEKMPLVKEGQSASHAVYSLMADPSFTRDTAAPDALYLRDTVAVDGLSFDRPFDIGGDDPRRLKSAVPIFLDAIMNHAPRRVLAFRPSYGILPLVSRMRFPDADIIAVERDLLGIEYIRRNAKKNSLAGEKLVLCEAHHFPASIADDEFDLAVGELSSSAGKNVALAELNALAHAAGKNGIALVLALEKNDREWIRPSASRQQCSLTRLISRDGYVLFQVRR
ncbi:MAG: methyltransferase [Spirochaetota bacterium]